MLSLSPAVLPASVTRWEMEVSHRGFREHLIELPGRKGKNKYTPAFFFFFFFLIFYNRCSWVNVYTTPRLKSLFSLLVQPSSLQIPAGERAVHSPTFIPPFCH